MTATTAMSRDLQKFFAEIKKEAEEQQLKEDEEYQINNMSYEDLKWHALKQKKVIKYLSEKFLNQKAEYQREASVMQNRLDSQMKIKENLEKSAQQQLQSEKIRCQLAIKNLQVENQQLKAVVKDKFQECNKVLDLQTRFIDFQREATAKLDRHDQNLKQQIRDFQLQVEQIETDFVQQQKQQKSNYDQQLVDQRLKQANKIRTQIDQVERNYDVETKILRDQITKLQTCLSQNSESQFAQQKHLDE